MAETGLATVFADANTEKTVPGSHKFYYLKCKTKHLPVFINRECLSDAKPGLATGGHFPNSTS
jgi:hypothetical protein